MAALATEIVQVPAMAPAATHPLRKTRRVSAARPMDVSGPGMVGGMLLASTVAVPIWAAILHFAGLF